LATEKQLATLDRLIEERKKNAKRQEGGTGFADTVDQFQQFAGRAAKTVELGDRDGLCKTPTTRLRSRCAGPEDFLGSRHPHPQKFRRQVELDPPSQICGLFPERVPFSYNAG